MAGTDLATLVTEAARRLIDENHGERGAALVLASFEFPELHPILQRMTSIAPAKLLRAMLAEPGFNESYVQSRIDALQSRANVMRYALRELLRDPHAAVSKVAHAAFGACGRPGAMLCSDSECGERAAGAEAVFLPSQSAGLVAGGRVCQDRLWVRLCEPRVWISDAA